MVPSVAVDRVLQDRSETVAKYAAFLFLSEGWLQRCRKVNYKYYVS